MYHGFMVYGSDTIETIPYALWMANPTLFAQDFHVQALSQKIPNERYLISYLLHLFPLYIREVSYIMHGIFTFILLGGMLRFADLVLKHFEFAVLAVFLCLFSFYNINIGANELYYNILIPSLAAKAFGIWALCAYFRQQYWWVTTWLIITSFLHPLVGFQLFVLLSGISLLRIFLDKKTPLDWKVLLKTSALYLFTAGIWIAALLWNSRYTLDNTITGFDFFDIVRFRIAHHFFPSFFPIKSVLLLLLIYGLSGWYWFRRLQWVFYFYILAVLGSLIYLLGLYIEWELILSSQWMKINIWLKFLALIGLMGWVQGIIERKYYRISILILFAAGLLLCAKRYQPTFDAPVPVELYSWIHNNTEKDACFLVPPELNSFKATTLRSSYFDFKAMLHHKPQIYHWAQRFQDIYGLDFNERPKDKSVFQWVAPYYLNGVEWQTNSNIQYIIVSQNQLHRTPDLKEQLNRVAQRKFSDTQYLLFKLKEQ